MKRTPKTSLNHETQKAIDNYTGEIDYRPPVLAQGSEAREGLKRTVKEAKRIFKYGA